MDPLSVGVDDSSGRPGYGPTVSGQAKQVRLTAPIGAEAGPADIPLQALPDLSLPRLRTLRRQARQEESDLSYLRRLLQGRIDILRAEQHRRGGQPSALLDLLPEILADAPSKVRGSARHVPLSPPNGRHYQELSDLVMSGELSDPQGRDDAELQRIRGQLVGYEQQVSRRRHELQRTADACSAEIGRRYRAGEAHVDDLLNGAGDRP